MKLLEKSFKDQPKKQRYTVDNGKLKLSINEERKVTKLHAVCLFKQSPWLTKEHPLERRIKSQSKKGIFEHHFHKLMINIFYWKLFKKHENV